MPQAAKELEVSAARVRQAVLDGSLKHVVMFGRKFIPKTALDEYLARSRPTGQKTFGRPRKPAA